MKDGTDLVLGVLQAADGEIVGKIRFQKVIYLLEQAGLGAGLAFSYHHYGPYSEALAGTLDFAELIDGSVVEEPRTTAKGFTFTAYKILPGFIQDRKKVGKLPFAEARRLIREMKSETSIVIELAATIHWLKFKERVADWRKELVRRKTTKATPEFVARAEVLLGKIGLGLSS